MRNFLKNFGPGFITASAAIGTSHFVQATRGGSYFGFELLWLILAVNIFKYPFIEFGSRYVSATGENLVSGYFNFSKIAFCVLVILTLIASPLSIAAIAFVCAGIIKEVLNIGLEVKIITAILLAFCIFLISYGRYALLDNLMKILIIILTLTTFLAVIFALNNYQPASEIFYKESAFNPAHIPFIIALMGWMPGPLDLSVWHSLWLKARNDGKNKLTFSQSRLDFNIGYLMTMITAILFLSIGALIIHNSNVQIPSGSDQFARLLINSYAISIDPWAAPIVGLAILAAMFSTLLAVVDIYPRTICESFYVARKDSEEKTKNKNNKFPDKVAFEGKINNLQSRKKEGNLTKSLENFLAQKRKNHTFSMIFFSLIAIFMILFLLDDFKTMVDLVTITAFLSAPFYAFVNYKLVTSKIIAKKFRPGKWLKLLSALGFLFLIIFVGVFLWSFFS